MKPSHCEIKKKQKKRETTLIEIKTILDLTEISNEKDRIAQFEKKKNLKPDIAAGHLVISNTCITIT